MEIVKVPRYIPEGKVNYNKVLLNPESLNKALDKMIEEKHSYVFIYRDVDERKNAPGGFHETDMDDVVGYVEGYDKEYIDVRFMEGKLVNNPVALITADVDDVTHHEDYNEYNVTHIVRIELVDETTLERPRIKL